MIVLREKTKKVKIKNLTIGGDNKIIIQSMASFKTEKISDVIKEAKHLEEIGCEMIRFSVLDEKDAKAFKTIKENISIPIVADIHFDYKLALLAIRYGADKIRINPGNIKNKDNLLKIINACKENNTAIRIGLNTGSINLNKENDLVDKMLSFIKFFESNNFYNIVLSIKSSDPELFYNSNVLLSKKTNYPIHLGLTESGDVVSGIVKSSIALNKLLEKGIGNTIRVSLPATRDYEIQTAKAIINSVGLGNFPNLIICPTCGRSSKNIKKVQEIIIPLTWKINKKITIAIMGCCVNGLLEARSADIGIFLNHNDILIYKNKQLVIKSSLKNLHNDFLKVINTTN